MSANGNALETFNGNRPARLWFYWRLVNSEGVVTAFTFMKQELKQQSITVYVGTAGSGLGESLLATMFEKTRVHILDRVSPYTVPDHPDGNEWGK